jgi:DNA-binding transcriptional ArsR family regulator
MVFAGLTKVSDLEAKASEAAELLKLMANEKRLLILCHLVARPELTVGALAEAVGLSQSAMSQHLTRLREDGLVVARRQSQMMHYRIADPKAAKVLELLKDLFYPDIAAG